jgi:hypothetical protein
MSDDNDDGMDFGKLLGQMRGDRKQSESIRDTVQPSTFIPKVGDKFRMRFATVGDRSYMDCIWQCLAHQDGAVLGKLLHGHTFGEGPRLFVIGDVLFYDCNEIWAAMTTPLSTDEAAQS